jgi:spectinomycin phosphotransferase
MTNMRTEPEGFPEATLVAMLREHWGVAPQTLEYAPVGFGSYHWIAVDLEGTRWFVTADNLRTMSSQDSPDVKANLAGLRAAYETASALRTGGLEFVVSPEPTLSGDPLVRLSPDWAVAVFPFLDGGAAGDGFWAEGEPWMTAARLVGELHHSEPPASIRRWNRDIPYQQALGEAREHLDRPWQAGPYGEATRRLLSTHGDVLSRAFERYDRLCASLQSSSEPWVVTHGEPHSANFVRTESGRLYFIDWDTVRLAPQERDLWILLERGDDALPAYQASSDGIVPRREVMKLFSLRWMLADVCIYVRRFASAHGDTLDDQASFRELEQWLLEGLGGSLIG